MTWRILTSCCTQCLMLHLIILTMKTLVKGQFKRRTDKDTRLCWCLVPSPAIARHRTITPLSLQRKWDVGPNRFDESDVDNEIPIFDSEWVLFFTDKVCFSFQLDASHLFLFCSDVDTVETLLCIMLQNKLLLFILRHCFAPGKVPQTVPH